MINLSMAEPDNMLRPRITVIGVGGAGGNAINNMIRSNLEGCDFVAANTDSQALAQSLAGRKIQLGVNLSRGLGAGSKPNIGCAAAEESLADIMSLLDGSDMLFVTAGMGGGTGTGAAPVIARAARESGILTVGVVTKPFHFEGTHRMRQAESGIAELQKYVDTLIVIPNQNLFRIANERTTFAEAFRMADEVLHSGVRGITDLMVMPGFMNLDFADVKTVMGEMGKAMMGTGEADGDNRAIRAAEAAISNPLLDDISMKGARGVLINITGGLDMTLFEVDQAANRIRDEVDPEAQIKVGSTLGDGLEGRIRVSVIATGIDAELDERLNSKRTETSASYPQTSAVQSKPSVRVLPQETRPLASVSPIKPQAQTPGYTQPQPQSQSARASSPVMAPQASTPSSPVRMTAEPAAPVSTSGSTSYFMMPATVTPKMMAQPQARSAAPVVMKPATTTAVDEEVTVVETQPVVQPTQYIEKEAVEVAPVAVARTLPPRSSAMQASPEAATVQQAQRHRSVPVGPREMAPAAPAAAASAADMRVTQLTTAANPPAATSMPINQRAQSLFQRITGFGMIRPSAAKEIEEEMADDLREEEDIRVSASDRSALSDGDSDLLDIPAFLRRQSNH